MKDRIVRSGIILVDKPSGPTSHDIVEIARRALNIHQIGHMGTLDPLATGLLILGIGEGTKLTPFLSDLDKTYEWTAVLGARSTTYDAHGTIEQVADPGGIGRDQIERAAEGFRGAIEQRPPAFSAAKIAGRPMYEYARRGEKVEARPRRVHIYQLEIVDYNPPAVQMRARVSGGTYIRSLVHDLGDRLGVGAYVAQIRRTAVGPFNIADGVDLAGGATAETLAKGWRSLADALCQWTTVCIPEALESAVRNGIAIAATGLAVSRPPLQPDGLYALLDDRNCLLAVARCVVSRGNMAVFGASGNRGQLVLKPLRVFHAK